MGAIVAGMIITFGILWLILVYLVMQDAKNDKILQDLKRRKKERKRRKCEPQESEDEE